MPEVLVADSLTQFNLISFDCGGGHVTAQWSDASNGYLLTNWSSGGTGTPGATVYASLTTLFAAAAPLVSPYAGPTSGDQINVISINCNPEHVLVVWNPATSVWQTVDFGPGGSQIPNGSYATVLLAFAAAAALF